MTTTLFFLSMATVALLPETLLADGPAKRPPRPPASLKYLWAKAYHVPPETTTEESGYFSLCEGKNGRIYIGCAADGRNSYLVEFNEVFARTNLVAWCIVPFDGKHRGPAERAALVKQLGFTKVAYDWRDNHVPSFEEEILQYRKHGIDYFAFWGTHDKAFELFAKYDLHPQIWQTLDSPNAPTQEERVALAAKRMLPLVERTAKAKCKLGLYNHGGWGGEPENLVAVCKLLREKHKAGHVGIVYNLHHGHGHMDDFKAALARMKPYLLCLNLNGMSAKGPQILPLGAGEADVKLLKIIADSGYSGPIGIIGHTQDDVELRLRDNLDGLDWILPQLSGNPAGPRPKYRTR